MTGWTQGMRRTKIAVFSEQKFLGVGSTGALPLVLPLCRLSALKKKSKALSLHDKTNWRWCHCKVIDPTGLRAIHIAGVVALPMLM